MKIEQFSKPPLQHLQHLQSPVVKIPVSLLFCCVTESLFLCHRCRTCSAPCPKIPVSPPGKSAEMFVLLVSSGNVYPEVFSMPRLPHSPRPVVKIPVSSPEKNLAPGCAWGGSAFRESLCLACFMYNVFREGTTYLGTKQVVHKTRKVSA